ncbi:MAG: efflux RND transporter permease subunit [Clostridiales Family XIII bacterium]|jgi:HAE1 family hydrophobic/amphiphilic exporter-1|nr:efflux RND transporter permease subunit [Clostridiales Family XIII bacterium]
MNFSKIAVKRPVTTIMFMLIIVVLGVVSFSRLSLDLLPKMQLPIAAVVTQYANSAPSEVESMITRPIENQIARVESLDSMTSMSMDGMSVVVAQFINGTDMDFATLHMRENVEMVSGYLPEEAGKPTIYAMDPSMMPVSVIYASSETLPLTELQEFIENEVVPIFERTEGIAAVSTFGGRSKEIRVQISQERLSGYYLTLSQLSQILAAENITLPSGDVTLGERDMIVRTIGEFETIDEIGEIPLLLPTREVIKLGDLGTIEEREREASSMGRMNGVSAIGMNVTKQTVANTVAVCRNIDASLAELNALNPEINFTVSYSEADFINRSVNNVAETAISGCILAVIVCFFFLRSLSSTLIIAISIPTSIIATFILMYFTGLTMNVLSLSGLAVGIGMLVDDSIVVMENIFRRRSIDKESGIDASILGTKEVTMPVFAATMTKIAVFLPIVFVEGIASTVFKEFSYTISFALICSLVVALTVVPMLCSRLLRGGDIGDKFLLGRRAVRIPILPEFDRAINALTEGYAHFLQYSIRHRKSVIAVALILLIMSGALIGMVGGVLIPSADEGSFTVSISTPYGTSIDTTDAIVSDAEFYIANNIPELKSYSVSIGASSLLVGSGGSNAASISVTLVDKKERDREVADVVKDVSSHLEKIVGAETSVAATSSMSYLISSGNPIAISVQGNDLDTLREIADDFFEIVKSVPGTINVSNSMGEGTPEIQVRINRNNAAFYGVTAYQLAQALDNSLGGITASTFKSDGTETNIVLSLDSGYGDSVEKMLQIGVMSSSGQTVNVGDIADIVYDNSPASIDREDQVRTATITAGISGRDLSSISSDIEKALSAIRLPNGYDWNMGGEVQEMMESFTSLFYALLLAVLIIYMILASQFESLIQPIIIMLAIPFALTGAFIALFVTNTPLSLIAFLGIIMLSGIVVNNSILLIDFINQNKSIYATRDEAIINAGRFRLRPILMTGLTTCLGLLPLSMGIGSGAELQAPMGITVIGGLLFSTVITLVLVPVIYTIVDDKSIKYNAKREYRKHLKMKRLEAAGLLPVGSGE